MNRILRGTVLLAASAVLWACNTEPDQVKGGDTPDHIVADPGVVFVAQGDSQPVKLSVVNKQGTQLQSSITISNVGAGIQVTPDSAFRPIFNSGDSLVFNQNSTEILVYVKVSDAPDQLLPWQFTVSGGGLTMDVPVTIYPKKAQDIAFSNTTPVLAEVLTVTPNIGIRFTDNTKVTFAGGPTPRIVSIAPDGTSMTLVAGPNTIGQATFTNVTVPYNNDLLFEVNSVAEVTGVKVDTFFVTASNTTPASNEIVNITLSGNPTPALYQFDPTGTTFSQGASEAVLLNVSADSQTAQILPEPGVDDRLTINSGLIDHFAQTLPSNVSLNVGALTPIAGTDAFATAPNFNAPAIGDAVAAWNGAPFGFDAGADFGGDAHLYKFTVPADGLWTFSLDPISDGADLGVYFYDAAFNPLGDAVDGSGGGSGNEESGDIALSAGTYYIAVVYFQYSASPVPPAKYRLVVRGIQP